MNEPVSFPVFVVMRNGHIMPPGIHLHRVNAEATAEREEGEVVPLIASPPAAQEQKPVAELEVRNGIVGLKHTLAPMEQFYDGMKLYASPIPASGVPDGYILVKKDLLNETAQRMVQCHADWVMVPREPTDAVIRTMCEAGSSGSYSKLSATAAIRVYRAMLSVAPGETK